MLINKKTTAIALAVTLLLPAVFAPAAYAAEPTPAYDETAYINMDYYGGIQDASVVKAVKPNGNKTFVDYGDYAKIKNMTDFTEPAVDGDKVQWQLDNSAKTFYYEGKLKETNRILPWNTDISYRLNGVPKKADELAGASGLIEISVEVTPNPAARGYYRDNMALILGTAVKDSDVLSFEAPGSQMQTIGNIKAAIYLAAPKEHKTFVFRIGSDSFESSGIFMGIVPLTLSQLDDLNDIEDDKQNIEDSYNAINNILNEMLGSTDKLTDGLTKTRDGMLELDKARKQFKETENERDASIDALQVYLNNLKDALNNLAYDVYEDDDDDEWIDKDKDDDDHEDLWEENWDKNFDNLSSQFTSTQQYINAINQSLARLQQYMKLIQLGGQTPSETQVLMQNITAEITHLNILLAGTTPDSQYSGIKTSVEKLTKMLSTIGSSSAASQQQIQQLIALILKEMNIITGSLSKTLTVGSSMITDVSEIADDLKSMGFSLEDVLESTENTLDKTADTVEQLNSVIDTTQSSLDKCKDSLNLGTELTLNGLASSLDEIIADMNKTKKIKSNKDTIHDVIDEKWKELDDDYGILDIRTNAQKVSFTSEKNPSPQSLQIILRSQEISLDDDDDGPQSLEPEAQKVNFFERIKSLFIKIGTIFGIIKK